MKIEFLTNTLTNQMTQSELHHEYVLKVIFSPNNLLVKVFITTMAVTLQFFASFTGAVYSKPCFYRRNVWTNFQAHIRIFFTRNFFTVKHKRLLLTRRWILLLDDKISSFNPYSIRLLWLNWKAILRRTEIHYSFKKHMITGWSV